MFSSSYRICLSRPLVSWRRMKITVWRVLHLGRLFARWRPGGMQPTSERLTRSQSDCWRNRTTQSDFHLFQFQCDECGGEALVLWDVSTLTKRLGGSFGPVADGGARCVSLKLGNFQVFFSRYHEMSRPTRCQWKMCWPLVCQNPATRGRAVHFHTSLCCCIRLVERDFMGFCFDSPNKFGTTSHEPDMFCLES